MRDDTRDVTQEVVAAIDAIEGVEATSVTANEYVRGDPTTDDRTVTGAEIEVTAYYSTGEAPDDDRSDRFRYDP